MVNIVTDSSDEGGADSARGETVARVFEEEVDGQESGDKQPEPLSHQAYPSTGPHAKQEFQHAA